MLVTILNLFIVCSKNRRDDSSEPNSISLGCMSMTSTRYRREIKDVSHRTQFPMRFTFSYQNNTDEVVYLALDIDIDKDDACVCE